MELNIELQKQKADAFRKLHHTEDVLILPNVWNPLGTAMLQDVGFKAAATSSSAMALTQGYHDGEHIPFNDFAAQLKGIACAVNIPVSADIESGFTADNNELVNNINAILDAGIVGINFEDTEKKSNTLLPVDEQCEKIALIRKTAATKGIPFFINARVDTYVRGGALSSEEKLQETIKRADAYKDAGADCFFPILLRDLNQIEALAAQVDLPLNIMALPGTPDFKKLKEAGVKRISLGSSFLKIAMQELKRFAIRLQSLEGMDEINANSIVSSYLDELIK